MEKIVNEEESREENIKVEGSFPAKKSRNFRKRSNSNEDSDVEKDHLTISDDLKIVKDLQMLRKRQHGVNIIDLTMGDQIQSSNSPNNRDPFKTQSGGMINMKTIHKNALKPSADDAYDTGIGTQFSAETNKRDEDEEMMKYIDEEISKRKHSYLLDSQNAPATTTKNKSTKPNAASDIGSAYITPEEAALKALPAHLRESLTKRSEEMLSNQMLNGIPEVDLGIETKIRNIEATEEAKLRLFAKSQKLGTNSQEPFALILPQNMAVNFTHHNRFNIDQNGSYGRHINKSNSSNNDKNPQKTKNKSDKATDDYYFEKFKKQFRR